jgi:crotonobetainyl-CoA:carnitine CoA-transferase CaiB-like acyl-CoA transferase
VSAPLTGIRVIDFTEYIAGPYCTMMLADMGADVIKVERPDGDAWRHTASVAAFESRMSLAVNRNKRSISLDLSKADSQEIVQRLVRDADVVVVNYRPGVAERLALTYETLREVNPRIIYAENTAFGKTGPYAGRPGFDILSQATTGMIMYENKIDHGIPSFIGTLAVADLSTGMFMAFAIVNALYARAQTGRGQRIDASLFASGLAVQYRPLFSVESVDAPVREGFLAELNERRKSGITYEESVALYREYVPGRGRNNYYRIYETKDSLIAIACLNNRQRRALRDTLGVEDPTVDGMGYDWYSEAVRLAHRETTQHYESRFREKPTAEWIELLDAADVPCAPVNFPEEMIDHPHVAANDLVVSVEHPIVGPLRMPRHPVRMSDTPPAEPKPSPYLGEHSAVIMRELGYDDAAIDRFFSGGVLWDRDRRIAHHEQAKSMESARKGAS